MFEEFRLTNIPIESKDTLPEMVRIGSFQRKTVEIPAFIPFESYNGFCFEITNDNRQDIRNQIQYIALSLLLQVNLNLLNLHIIDIGITTEFPYIKQLNIGNIKYWTNKSSIKEGLKKLTDEARKISSSCLGFSFSSLTEYNKQTDIKEPYNILFIPNFPKDFKDEEIDLVHLLITEAKQCGIYVILGYDKTNFPELNSINSDKYKNLFEIPKQQIFISNCEGNIKLNNFDIQIIKNQFEKYPFLFESYKNNEISDVISKLKKSFEQSDSYTDFISIPIGRSGREEIKFEMGMKSDVYHCMIAGQSGTGKSTFLNLIITKIAEYYTPNEIRLYLLDYKEGVEFIIYKNHPNVESLLLDNSNIEYAINVLEEFESEIQKRADLFSNLGTTISDIDKYNSKSDLKIPRLIMIIDEVQELFTKGYEFSRRINKVLFSVISRGRSFGVHFIFSSPSYANCKIDDGVLKQTKLRISFNLPDNSDCRSIMGRDNDAPLGLKRFQIVYNTKNGNPEKNIIVNTYNIDKEKIEGILKSKTKDYEKFDISSMKIIEKSNSSERINKDSNHNESGSTAIKTVKRDCKIQINNELDGL